jgi:hypothetical protein
MTSAPGGSGKCSPTGRPSPVSEGVAAWACVLCEDASRQSWALKLHQTSGLRCPHRVKPALAFASRTGDRAQTRGYPGAIVCFECAGYSMPSRAMLKAIDAFRDQQEGQRASQASPRQAERHAAFIPAGRLQARHETRSRDIFPGHLADCDCRPVMSGLRPQPAEVPHGRAPGAPRGNRASPLHRLR